MIAKRWIALVVLVVLATGLVVAALTVPWGDDSSRQGNAAVYQTGDSISTAKGDEFVVALAANLTTGYEWTAAENPNVTFVSSKQVSGDSGLAGAPGKQQLTFRATKTGSNTLVVNYARSFEQDVAPAKTENFPVTVR